MIQQFTGVCVNKVKETHINTFVLAIFAGMFIAFGASSSNLAIFGIENAGLAKLTAGVIFPVGLMMIVAVAGELFTGDCMLVFGNFDKKYSIRQTVEKLIIVYFGNFVGAVMTVALLYAAGQYDFAGSAVGAYTIKVAAGKLQMSFGRCVASGILCNILVCAAVLMAARISDVSGKLWACFFPIMVFVIGGFEHCVANMYYLSAGFAAAHNAAYVQKASELYRISAEAAGMINISNIIVNNLIPVTIGNILGGMLFISLPLYLLQGKKN